MRIRRSLSVDRDLGQPRELDEKVAIFAEEVRIAGILRVDVQLEAVFRREPALRAHVAHSGGDCFHRSDQPLRFRIFEVFSDRIGSDHDRRLHSA